MEKKIITICYRKIIDINSKTPWEKLVFEDSFKEFKIQSQLYNQDKKHTTFSALLHEVAGAEKLHFLVSGAIIDYIRQLKDIVPDIVNNIGRHFLSFDKFKFEIINSDINNIEKHAVSICFFSHPLIWHNTIGQYLLTSPHNNSEGEILTNMFAIQPFLTIHSIQSI
ncbi:MAG: hypothetical protein EOO96_24530 [Pedobacter sp.]|nr:MAG: hypothetical protein EOO96_24530 [Pedobacter sp.]